MEEIDYVNRFYELLAAEDEDGLKDLHIPRSDVFYVRNALELRTGIRYPLARIEEAMLAEGMLPGK